MAQKAKAAAYDGSSLLHGEKLGGLMPMLGYNGGHCGAVTDEDLGEMLRQQEDDPVDPASFLHNKTRRLRERVWELWEEYVPMSPIHAKCPRAGAENQT